MNPTSGLLLASEADGGSLSEASVMFWPANSTLFSPSYFWEGNIHDIYRRGAAFGFLGQRNLGTMSCGIDVNYKYLAKNNINVFSIRYRCNCA